MDMSAADLSEGSLFWLVTELHKTFLCVFLKGGEIFSSGKTDVIIIAYMGYFSLLLSEW